MNSYVVDIDKYKFRVKVWVVLPPVLASLLSEEADATMALKAIGDGPEMAHKYGFAHPNPALWSEEETELAIKVLTGEALLKNFGGEACQYYPYSLLHLYPSKQEESGFGLRHLGDFRTMQNTLSALKEGAIGEGGVTPEGKTRIWLWTSGPSSEPSRLIFVDKDDYDKSLRVIDHSEIEWYTLDKEDHPEFYLPWGMGLWEGVQALISVQPHNKEEEDTTPEDYSWMVIVRNE